MAVMEPFRLQARLLRGVAIEPYGLDLSGILASRLWREQKERYVDQNISNHVDSMVERPEDLNLPLDICAVGEEWHWQATCASYEVDARHPQTPHTYYKVVNDSWASRAVTRPIPYYHPRSGAYRDVMMPAPITLTGTLTWWGVGDIEKIKKLVSNIRFIGKRRAKGEGRVLEWKICAWDTNDKWKHGHQGNKLDLLRPIPIECADRLGIQYELDWFAIRPPSWNPNRLMKLAVQKEDDIYLPEEWEL